jgi:predicted ATPase
VRRSATAEPRTVGLAPGNLPPLRDPFFGRRDEVRQLADRVRGPERLLVLKGPGGTGKTRLALAVAREVSADLPGGSWFVDLSEAVTSAGVCSAVATAFQVPLDRQDPVRQLGRAFAYRGRSLFVLDNLEQIVDALPETLSRWLELAPEATFLCTSRLPLRLSGERVIPVEPLPVEDGVELFLDRSPRPPSAAERPIVADLVAALEGLPLAIELAAARTRLMPVRRLRERLSDRLKLLADGDRDRPSRQRSLTASLDGSWDLLAPWARDALVQLAVFEGGSTLEAAEGVLDLARHPDAPWAVDVLAELVDASLLRTDPSGDRFRMLVVVQEWARTRAEPGALAAAEVRHGQWYARAGTDDAVARWARPGGVSNHQELLPELDNLAAACRRAIARGDAAVAAATCSAAGDWLVFRGPVSTLVELAESVLALPGVSLAGRRRVAALLATAHLNAGRLADAAGAHSLALGLAEREGNAVARAYLHGRIAWRLQLEGRGEEATAELARAEAVARRHPAPEVEVVALREIGGVHWLAGRLPEARRVFERVIPLARRLGDERTEAFCTGNLGLVAVYLGDRRSARTHFERALVALARHGDRRNAALIHVNMGLVLHESGQLREARTQYQYALAELGQVGDERGRAMAASNLGYVLHELGECTAARELLEDTLTATRRASDLPTELLTLANLGLLQWDLGDADGAARAWAETLERCTRTAQHRTATIVAAQLALASLELGRFDEAREHLATARSAAVAAGLDREAWHAGVAARITLATGSVEDGLRGLADAADALRRADDLLWVPLRVQWAAAGATTHPEAAAGALDEVVTFLRAGGYGGGLAEALIHRARARPATAAADRAEAQRILDRGGYGPTAPLRRALDGVTAPR